MLNLNAALQNMVAEVIALKALGRKVFKAYLRLYIHKNQQFGQILHISIEALYRFLYKYWTQ